MAIAKCDILVEKTHLGHLVEKGPAEIKVLVSACKHSAQRSCTTVDGYHMPAHGGGTNRGARLSRKIMDLGFLAAPGGLETSFSRVSQLPVAGGRPDP